MDEEKHFPGAEPEIVPEAEPEQAKPEQAPQDEPKPNADAEKPEGEEPEADKPKDDEPNPLPKKRSIYDDLKDEKRDRKDWQKIATEALKAQGIELKGTETVTDLQALLKAKSDAVTPEEKANADADIEAFAEAEGVTPESLDKLVKFVTSKIPKPEMPEGMTSEELADWRADRARVKQTAEDNEIRAQSSSVKKELGISDDAELAKVMDEVVKLAHTDAFHDKEVDYIVWKNKTALSKLVSPKKQSFEQGSQQGDAGDDASVEFSGKMTPATAEKAMYQGRSKGSGVEIRSAK